MTTRENTPLAPLAESELDRLELLLDDPALEDALCLDEIQGILCAALSGPRPFTEEEWLVEILGGEDALTSETGQEAAPLLRRFAAALEAELAAGNPPPLLLYPQDEGEDSPSDYAAWCQAYLDGIDQAPEDWFDFFEGEDEASADEEIDYLDECLFPLMVLAGEAEAAAREHGEEWPGGAEKARLESESENELPRMVADLYRFWATKRAQTTVAVRRAAPKTGRNAPCSCGSGKKYKQCCSD